MTATAVLATVLLPGVTAQAQEPPGDTSTTTTTTVAESTTTTTSATSTTTTTTTTTTPTTTTIPLAVAPPANELAETAAFESAAVLAAAPEPSAAVAAPLAAAAPSSPNNYFQAPHSDTIYVVEGGVPRAISYAEWLQAGSPTPQPAPTKYVSYTWSPSIYALTTWQAAPSSWQWEHLSYPQWQRAGSPAPAPVFWIPGSYFYRWGTSMEVLVEGPDGINHKLTYDEWAASGFQSFDDRRNEGFVKLSWSDSIAFMSNMSAGHGSPISFARWQEEGFPGPHVAARLAGDRFTQVLGEPTIYYSGPTMTRAITYPEWLAAGSPAPTVEAPPLPANSGSGRRVVYDRGQQRVWAVEADGTVVKTHRVSGRLREPYAGTYSVYSRSMYTYSTANPDIKWRYMVRFAYGPDGGRIGFHEIPTRFGVPLQSEAQLGQPLSGGCVRQSTGDAQWMWNWAGVGTTVVVL